MKKLSKKSEQIVEAFDQAAKDWGWQEDQGNGKLVEQSKKEYEETKEALINRLLYLEQKIRHLQAEDS